MSADDLALAKPIDLGGVVLRNRILMAPISTNYADENGRVTEKTLGFYGERARGGAGALIFEALNVDRSTKVFLRQHGLYDDSFVPGLAEVAAVVHSHGARLFAQLCHGGPKAVSSISGAQPLSASAVAVKVGDEPRPMTVEQIGLAVERFADAALRAREAGFDGVELHAAHFYLLSAFLSGHLNRRTDGYGGSVANRTRLVRETIHAVKARAGSDYPVICRIHGRESLEGGIDEAEAREIARLLADAGADAIHVSAGTVEVNPRIAPLFAVKVGAPPTAKMAHGCFVEYAASIRRVVRVPVIAVGKLNEAAVAEQAIRDGSADLVAIGRGLIADPHLPAKVLSGRWDDIIRCRDCLTCHTCIQQQRDMDCSANPQPWRPKVAPA